MSSIEMENIEAQVTTKENDNVVDKTDINDDSILSFWHNEYVVPKSEIEKMHSLHIDTIVHAFTFLISFLCIASMFLPGNLDDFRSNDAFIYTSLFKGIVGMICYNSFSITFLINSYNNTAYSIPKILQLIVYPLVIIIIISTCNNYSIDFFTFTLDCWI